MSFLKSVKVTLLTLILSTAQIASAQENNGRAAPQAQERCNRVTCTDVIRNVQPFTSRLVTEANYATLKKFIEGRGYNINLRDAVGTTNSFAQIDYGDSNYTFIIAPLNSSNTNLPEANLTYWENNNNRSDRGLLIVIDGKELYQVTGRQVTQVSIESFAANFSLPIMGILLPQELQPAPEIDIGDKNQPTAFDNDNSNPLNVSFNKVLNSPRTKTKIDSVVIDDLSFNFGTPEIKIDTDNDILAASGCTSFSRTNINKSAIGLTLFTFTHQQNWCYDSSKVWSASATAYQGSYLAPGWVYRGISQSSNGYGSNQSYYYSSRRGKFELCTGIWGCWQQTYPGSQIWGKPNGNYSVSSY